MKVQHKDLILSTQGRSFWILDDVTPLHEVNEGVAGSDVHLYTPRDAYRANTGAQEPDDDDGQGGIDPDPLPGKALIHYVLSEAAEGDITLEIVDAGGGVVRRFTSDEEESRTSGQRPLPVEAGMNRIAWDLTYAGPDKPEDVILWGYGGGVKAPPGTYQARLTALGKTQTRSFNVLADPRLDNVTQQDFDEQFRLSIQVRDAMNELYGSIRRVRDVREQLKAVAERARSAGYGGSIQTEADAIVEKLTEVEEIMVQTKNKSGQDPIRFAPRLEMQFVALYENVTGVDEYRSGGPEGKPTPGAYERFEDLKTEWNEAKGRLQSILDSEITRFNQTLQSEGVPPIMLRK
jgi:hypothetical protein